MKFNSVEFTINASVKSILDFLERDTQQIPDYDGKHYLVNYSRQIKDNVLSIYSMVFDKASQMWITTAPGPEVIRYEVHRVSEWSTLKCSWDADNAHHKKLCDWYLHRLGFQMGAKWAKNPKKLIDEARKKPTVQANGKQEKQKTAEKREPRHVPKRGSKRFKEWCDRWDATKHRWSNGRESLEGINQYLLANYPDLACPGDNLDTLRDTIRAGELGYLKPLDEIP